MGILTGNTIASTYLPLLRITNNTMGTDGTAYFIKDSVDTNSVLSISTTRVGIGTDSPSVPLEIGSSGQGVTIAAVTYTQMVAIQGKSDSYLNTAAITFGDNHTSDSRQWTIANGSAAAAGAIGYADANTRGCLNIGVAGTNNADPYAAHASNRHVMALDPAGNVGIGTDTFDGSVVGYLTIKNGTEPSAHTDDQVYIGAKNSAGTGTDTFSTLSIFCEEGVDGTPMASDPSSTFTHRFPIWINGTAYWIALDPV